MTEIYTPPNSNPEPELTPSSALTEDERSLGKWKKVARFSLVAFILSVVLGAVVFILGMIHSFESLSTGDADAADLAARISSMMKITYIWALIALVSLIAWITALCKSNEISKRIESDTPAPASK